MATIEKILAEQKIDGQHDVTLETWHGQMGYYIRYGRSLEAKLDIMLAREAFNACCRHAQECAGWFDE